MSARTVLHNPNRLNFHSHDSGWGSSVHLGQFVMPLSKQASSLTFPGLEVSVVVREDSFPTGTFSETSSAGRNLIDRYFFTVAVLQRVHRRVCRH